MWVLLNSLLLRLTLGTFASQCVPHEKQTQRNTEKDIAKSTGDKRGRKGFEGRTKTFHLFLHAAEQQGDPPRGQRSHSNGRYVLWVGRERSVL